MTDDYWERKKETKKTIDIIDKTIEIIKEKAKNDRYRVKTINYLIGLKSHIDNIEE